MPKPKKTQTQVVKVQTHTNEHSDPIIKTDTTPKRDFSLEPIKQENGKHVSSNDLQNNENSDNQINQIIQINLLDSGNEGLKPQPNDNFDPIQGQGSNSTQDGADGQPHTGQENLPLKCPELKPTA
jgi:hypothetical protein